jgi:hypothetical protein
MHSHGRLAAVPGPGPGPAPVLASGTGWPPASPARRPAAAAGITGVPAGRPPGYPAVPLAMTGERGRPGPWLRNAAAGLMMLAGAAAAVSFSAQYRLAEAARHLPVIAGLEAAIPDAAALVFACLGIALAQQGRAAVRARFLNLAAVATSVFMNAIAAGPGWRAGAIWVMPPAAYALASDTLIGVVRILAAARRGPGADPAAEATPLAALGGAARWLLRLAAAPASTLAGFRGWVIAECPVAPGTRAGPAARPAPPAVPASAAAAAAAQAGRDGSRPAAALRRPRPGTKTARFLALAEREHGPLHAVPLAAVGRIAAGLAPRAGLHPGAARTALRAAILAARSGAAGPGPARHGPDERSLR